MNEQMGICGHEMTSGIVYVEVVDGPDGHVQRFKPYCTRIIDHPRDARGHTYTVAWDDA